jgi:glycolate oxidase iron-sulfur subunit
MMMFDEAGYASSEYYIPDEMDCRTCNMCVSHCPTFKISREAAESPRGRLKLIDKVLNKDETLTTEELGHLESCLQCRACESACPSKMEYGKLINSALEKNTPAQPSPLIRALLYATGDMTRLQQVFTTLRLSQQWGLQTLARRLGLFKAVIPAHLDHLLPKIPKQKQFADFYPAVTQRCGTVGLFKGCFGSVLDHATLDASIKLLTHLGYDVHLPSAQQCCGAMHEHNNDHASARELAAVNLNAFVEHEVDAILYTATGCGAMLRQYDALLTELNSKDEMTGFVARLTDISQFLNSIRWPLDLSLAPLPRRVAVHEPCSQRFPLATQSHVYELLQRIPGLDVYPLPENNLCCGAGGSYMLTHPEQSEAIRADKLKQINETSAQVVVTSNIGCALHLAAGIDKEKMQVVVAHPVELLAQQLQTAAV